MVYRGHIENGVAVLEGEVRLPEGTPVEIFPLGATAEVPEDDPFYRVYELAMPTGIPDLAENLDHYLYGHPKVSDERP
jgi:hypothetical protein